MAQNDLYSQIVKTLGPFTMAGSPESKEKDKELPAVELPKMDENIIDPFKSLREKVGLEAFKREFAKGIVGSVSTIAQNIRELGERAESTPEDVALKEIPYLNAIWQGWRGVRKVIADVAEKTDIDEKIASSAQSFAETWAKGVEAKFGSSDYKTQLERTMGALGGGFGSLATMLGTFALTKSPSSAAALMGFISKGSAYAEARAAGKTPERAGDISTAVGVGNMALERTGFEVLMTQFKQPIMNIVGKGAIEAIEEGLQSITESGIMSQAQVRKYKNIGEVIKNAGMPAFVGLVTGGTFGTVRSVMTAKITQETGMPREAADILSDKLTRKMADGAIDVTNQAVVDFASGGPETTSKLKRILEFANPNIDKEDWAQKTLEYVTSKGGVENIKDPKDREIYLKVASDITKQRIKYGKRADIKAEQDKPYDIIPTWRSMRYAWDAIEERTGFDIARYGKVLSKNADLVKAAIDRSYADMFRGIDTKTIQYDRASQHRIRSWLFEENANKRAEAWDAMKDNEKQIAGIAHKELQGATAMFLRYFEYQKYSARGKQVLDEYAKLNSIPHKGPQIFKKLGQLESRIDAILPNVSDEAFELGMRESVLAKELYPKFEKMATELESTEGIKVEQVFDDNIRKKSKLANNLWDLYNEIENTKGIDISRKTNPNKYDMLKRQYRIDKMREADKVFQSGTRANFLDYLAKQEWGTRRWYYMSQPQYEDMADEILDVMSPKQLATEQRQPEAKVSTDIAAAKPRQGKPSIMEGDLFSSLYHHISQVKTMALMAEQTRELTDKINKANLTIDDAKMYSRFVKNALGIGEYVSKPVKIAEGFNRGFWRQYPLVLSRMTHYVTRNLMQQFTALSQMPVFRTLYGDIKQFGTLPKNIQTAKAKLDAGKITKPEASMSLLGSDQFLADMLKWYSPHISMKNNMYQNFLNEQKLHTPKSKFGAFYDRVSSFVGQALPWSDEIIRFPLFRSAYTLAENSIKDYRSGKINMDKLLRQTMTYNVPKVQLLDLMGLLRDGKDSEAAFNIAAIKTENVHGNYKLPGRSGAEQFRGNRPLAGLMTWPRIMWENAIQNGVKPLTEGLRDGNWNRAYTGIRSIIGLAAGLAAAHEVTKRLAGKKGRSESYTYFDTFLGYSPLSPGLDLLKDLGDDVQRMVYTAVEGKGDDLALKIATIPGDRLLYFAPLVMDYINMYEGLNDRRGVKATRRLYHLMTTKLEKEGYHVERDATISWTNAFLGGDVGQHIFFGTEEQPKKESNIPPELQARLDAFYNRMNK